MAGHWQHWQLSSLPFFTSIRDEVSSPTRLVEALGILFGSRRRNHARAETKGYAPVSRRAFDSPQKCRLR